MKRHILLLLNMALPLWASAKFSPAPDPLTAMAPFPSLVAFASSHQLPMTGIDLADADAAPRKGDQVTLLVTLFNGSDAQQWLACLTKDDLTANEVRMEPPEEAVIHTSTGLELHFVTSRTALSVRFIGPFSANSPASPGGDQGSLVNKARALVSPEYMDAGFDGYCRSALEVTPRIKATSIKPHYSAGSMPRPSEELREAEPFNNAVHLTPEEERLDFGVYFSIATFFNAATEVTAFRKVLEQVVNEPSLWSIITHRGVRMDLNFWWMNVRAVGPGRIGAPLPAYQFPIEGYLNGAIGAKATLVVCTPRPPLETCAGIMAMCIEDPTDQNRRLFIRILAARR
jgi:hypothetical protein